MLSGLSGGDGERSDEQMELDTSDLASAWAGTCVEYGGT